MNLKTMIIDEFFITLWAGMFKFQFIREMHFFVVFEYLFLFEASSTFCNFLTILAFKKFFAFENQN